MARHYAQHGPKDPEGYFDSDDEEVQQILSPRFDAKGVDNSSEVNCFRDTYCSAWSATTNFKMLKAIDWSQDSESIEGISGLEELEDEVLLGYFATEGDGN